MAKEVTHIEMQQFVTEHSVDVLPTQNVNSPRLKDSEFADGRIVIQVYEYYMYACITCCIVIGDRPLHGEDNH